MKKKNIFSELNFTPIQEKDLVYGKKNTKSISETFEKMFQFVGATEQVIITKTLADEAYAISTAEDSSLSKEEAAHVQMTDEQSLRILKYQKSDMPIEKKYEQLEYENIRILSNQSSGLGFRHLENNLLCELHTDLTVGLDEYASALEITKYHPGKFRHIDSIKVGKFPPYIPPKHKEIPNLLSLLFQYYQEKSEIHFVDILEFGILLYAIHPFQNGNKRIVRILESSLLEFYGYSAKRSISLGRHFAIEKMNFHHFLLYSLHHRNTTSFVNFSLRGYLQEGARVMFEVYADTARIKIGIKILPLVGEKKRKQYRISYNLFAKHITLRNSEFVEKMKQEGYSHSISQAILKDFLQNEVLEKTPDKKYAFQGFFKYKSIQDKIKGL